MSGYQSGDTAGRTSRSDQAERKAMAQGDQEFIQSLAKGLAVIEAFSEATPHMTLSEVAREVGLSPGSARRVLRTLQMLGYASCQGTHFELTPRVLQLGYSYLTSLPVANLVRPLLTELTEQVGANCGVSVLDGPDLVFVARTTSKHTSREPLGVGSRFPAYTTSAGKVLLADLDRRELEQLYTDQELDALTANSISTIDQLYDALEQVRVDGWALNDQETMVGHRSISVPVRVNGRSVAAVGVGAHVGMATKARMIESFLPPLRESAESIAGLLRNHLPAEPRTRRGPGRPPRPRNGLVAGSAA